MVCARLTSRAARRAATTAALEPPCTDTEWEACGVCGQRLGSLHVPQYPRPG